MYQALYRKYRPTSFSDVIGQDHVTETLRRQVETGRLSHAYLFVGTRGTGKTTCAKILSRALNCEHPVNGNPCNECASCRGIESGSVMDVVEIDAASNNGVDNIRAIRDEAAFTPVSVKKRVYIIDEVHMLSTSAFNALLKILEEPPEHLVFILATTELRKVPATILSRCQRFTFKRIGQKDIVKRLNYVASREEFNITPEASALIARLADGAMRDALSLLDQCIMGDTVTEENVLEAVGLTGSNDTAALFKCIAAGDIPEIIGCFEGLYQGGRDPSSILSELLTLCRDMMMIKLSPKGAADLISGTFGVDTLSRMSAGIDAKKLIAASEAIQETMSTLGTLRDKRTSSEICLIRISGIITGAGNTGAGSARPEPSFIMAADTGSPAAAPKTPLAPPIEQKRTETARTIPPEIQKPIFEPAPWEDYNEPPFEDGINWDMLAANGIDKKGDNTKSSEPQYGREPTPPSHTASCPDDNTAPKSAEASLPGGWWEKILHAAKNEVPASSYTFLADGKNLYAEEEGGRMTLYAKNDFIRLMVDNTEVKSAVTHAAMSVLGHPVSVRVAIGSAPVKLREDKLDELSRFKNIKFE